MKKNDLKTEIIKEIRKSAAGDSYVYRLVMNKSSQVSSYRLPLYSIEVEMDHDGEHTANSTKELFSDVGRALAFLSYLAEHLVTPLNLPFVLEDSVCP